MTTDKDHTERLRRNPQILITEEQFFAAERTIADLLAKRSAVDDLLRDKEGREGLDLEHAQIDPLNDEIFGLYEDVCASPPLTRHGALIKLRLAVNPALGLDEGSGKEFSSLRQAAAFLSGEPEAYVSLPAGMSRLQKIIAVEDQIRSLAVKISDAADVFKFWLDKQEPSVQELAAGVDLDEIYRLYNKIDDGVPDALRDQITNTAPASLAEAIALLELDDPPLDAVIAGLRAIAEKGGAT